MQDKLRLVPPMASPCFAESALVPCDNDVDSDYVDLLFSTLPDACCWLSVLPNYTAVSDDVCSSRKRPSTCCSRVRWRTFSRSSTSASTSSRNSNVRIRTSSNGTWRASQRFVIRATLTAFSIHEFVQLCGYQKRSNLRGKRCRIWDSLLKLLKSFSKLTEKLGLFVWLKYSTIEQLFWEAISYQLHVSRFALCNCRNRCSNWMHISHLTSSCRTSLASNSPAHHFQGSSSGVETVSYTHLTLPTNREV